MYAVPKLETFNRLAKQDELLSRLYQSELGKDPFSLGTETSRSNLIAIRHTANQMYGELADPGAIDTVLTPG